VCWCGLQNAWLAILAYHAQILFHRHGRVRPPRARLSLRPVLLAASAGPAAYLLLPLAARADLATLLSNYGLEGWSLLLMIPYFGLVHPVLEQAHWAPLRGTIPGAHLWFAGYHILVLATLLHPGWLPLCVLVLAGVSWTWGWMEGKGCAARTVVATHIAADVGVILAAWARL
jgi:hypothetical protein